MRTWKKRSLSLLLVFALLVSLTTALAAGDEVIESGVCGATNITDIQWTLTSDGTLTFSGSGNMAFNYHPWRNSYEDEIKRVIVGEGIKDITYSAFYGCENLISINFPSTLSTIGEAAFQNCRALAITELPDTISSIRDFGFSGCEAMQLEHLPENVDYGRYAFQGCKALKLNKIPRRGDGTSVGTIPDGAFEGCIALTDIEIEEGVKTIGTGAFGGCTSLTNVKLPSTLTTMGVGAFGNCKSLVTVDFQGGYLSIGDSGFAGCESLALTSLPDGLARVGMSAFVDCKSMALRELPERLTDVGHEAFKGVFWRIETEHYIPNNNGYVLEKTTESLAATGEKAEADIDGFTDRHLIPASNDNEYLSQVIGNYIPYGGAITFRRYYDFERYTVTIEDDQGGSSTQEVAYGGKAVEPKLDPKPGHTLTWETSDGDPFDFNTPITESVTVHPVWTLKKIAVTISDGNGGSTIQEVEYGSKAIEPELDPKPGHTLTWESSDGDPFDFNTPITEPVTVHPVWTPDIITVTINDDQGGSTTQDVPYGGKATEPELEERPGYKLVWVTDGGEHFDFETPITKPITISPVWAPVGAIHGVVVDNQGRPVPDAHIAIVAGNTNYMETDADANGHFWIYDVPYGSYDMITTKRALTVTSLFELDETVGEVTVTLPDAQTNSVLLVNQGTKDVVVGGLDELFASEIYNEADQATVANGGSVTVQMTVKAVTEEEIPESAQDLNAAAAADGKTIFGYMEMDVSKITETAAGETMEENIPELPQLLQIIDPLSEEQKGKTGYVVYRMHEGTVYPITELPNVNGAYITVSDDTLTIYASKFSAYCLAFDAPEEPEPSPDPSPEPEPSPSPKPGPDPMPTPSPEDPSDDNDNNDQNRDPFVDVRPGDWYYKDIMGAYHAGYMEGITSDTFKPNAALSRAQAAYAFAGMAEAKLEGLEITGDFADVAGQTRYAEAITWANDARVEIGYGNGFFGPNDRLTREQMALMLYRTYGRGEKVLAWETSFEDMEDVSTWAEAAVRWAVHVGLLEGTDAGKLLPQGRVTRAEAAALLMRMANAAGR